MSEDREMPIKIDVGASAKFSLDVKAEIPSEATGRFVDAIVQILSPWAEARAFKADMIRMYREEVALKIAQKAAERLRIERAPIHPIPLKVLIPLLEKGSQEDLRDGFMVDMWASLLSSSAVRPTISPRYVTILSELTSPDAALLTQITRGKNYLDIGASRPGVRFPSEVIDSVLDETPQQVADQISDYFQDDRTYLSYSTIYVRDGTGFHDVQLRDPVVKDASLHSLSILESLHLLKSTFYKRRLEGRFITSMYFHWYETTMLADTFMDHVMPEHPNYE